MSITELPVNKEYAAAVETKQIAQQEAQDAPRSQQTTSGKPSTRSKNSDTALPITRPAQSLDHESEQDKDAERINEGEETTNDVHWESNGSYDTLEGETFSHAEFNVPDVRDHETKYGDDIEAQGTIPPVIRLAPELAKAHQEFEQDENIKGTNGHVWSPTLSQLRSPPEPPPAAGKSDFDTRTLVRGGPLASTRTNPPLTGPRTSTSSPDHLQITQ